MARRLGGYAAAASLSLYLVVKVVWIVAAALGHVPSHFGGAGWIALNVVTVGMAATGIVLGLVLARGSTWRIPAAPLVFLTWMGSGFLIPVLPYSLVSAVLGGSGEEDAGGDTAPSWEVAFIGVGFTGMAIGLAVALPLYMRERWPAAFLGRLNDRERTAVHQARTAAALAALPTAFWTLWSAGGTLGQRDLVDGNTRLLLGNSALWAVLGAWSVLAVSAARRKLPAWPPVALAFTASGSLFAWGGWKLAVAVLRPGGYTPAEHPPVAIALNGLAAAAGLLMLSTLITALRSTPTSGPSPRV
ncbi:hypothetical protein GWI34_30230 [Actinomadura sp. DSM 109109]|nr:hypothetical protein [Actinomadura lepetitiana]